MPSGVEYDVVFKQKIADWPNHVMSPRKTWVTSPQIPFDELDGKPVFCARMESIGQYFGMAIMHVEQHRDDPRKAIIRVESESPSTPRWIMFLDQTDVALLEPDETSITRAFTCRG